MKSLAENLKGVIAGSNINFQSNAPSHPGLLTQSSNLTAGLEELAVPRGSQETNKSAFYEIPRRVHDLSEEQDDVENVNSSANKPHLRQQQRMYSPAKKNQANTTNSPYFQSSSKFSMQVARNAVNASTTSMSNVYKRDRSSSNNVRRPPMPTNSSIGGQ